MFVFERPLEMPGLCNHMEVMIPLQKIRRIRKIRGAIF